MPKLDIELYRPKEMALSVSSIDFEKLHDELGICYAIFDKDGTLTEPDGRIILPDARDTINHASDQVWLYDKCVLSNLITRNRWRQENLSIIAAEIEAHAVGAYLRDRKPRRPKFDECLNLMRVRAIANNREEPTVDNTVVIGDQLHTDILGGNLIGMYTIWVKPYGDDHWITWLKRRQEKSLCKQLGLSFDLL